MTAAPDGTDTVPDPAADPDAGAVTQPDRIDPPDLTIVTGAGGWLGRALVDHLVRDGGPYARPSQPPAPVTIVRSGGSMRSVTA